MRFRLRTALIHLLCSVVLVGMSCGIALLIWYPAPLSQAVGLQKILLILCFIDLGLGPLLTLIVADKRKQRLWMDLAVIVAIQLLALGYGLHTIANARPVWLVFNMDRFDLVQAQDVDQRKVSKAAEEFKGLPWSGPRWVASRNPTNADERNELMFESAQGGPDLPQRVDLFVSLPEEAATIKNKAKPLSELAKFNAPSAVTAVLEVWPDADAWLPLAAKEKSMVVLIQRVDAKPIAVVDLHPWAED